MANDEAEQYSPDKLMFNFNGGRIITWFGVALAVHVVLIVATSTGYIRDNWIDPEGAKRRAEEAKAQSDRESQKLTAAKPESKPEEDKEGKQPPAETKTKATSTKTPKPEVKTDKQIMEERKDTSVVKRVTDTATKQEIPTAPDNLSLPPDDNNK